MPRGAVFLGPHEELRAFTFVGPAAILDRLRQVSDRLRISKHVLGTLALDEFLTRHYPTGGLNGTEQEAAGIVGDWAQRVSPREKAGDHASPEG
jgi:hypothetical protein